MSDEKKPEVRHVFDGIEELDNRLPNWWLGFLWITIVFSAGYWFYYETTSIGPTQQEELKQELAAIEAKKPKEVALSGRLYDATEALAMGYVSKVFPEGELLSSVAAIAREMAAFDRMTLVETKRLSNEVLHQSLDGSMRMQEWLFRTYIGAEDNHRRIDALQAQLAAARAKKG